MRLPRPEPPDVAGAALAVGALLALAPLGALLAAAVVAGLGLVARDRRRRGGCVLVAVMLGGGWLCGAARVRMLDADPLAPRVGHAIVDGAVVVEEGWHGGGRSRIALGRVLGAGGGRVLLRLEGADGPPRGSVLRVDGSLERPHGPDGGFDERAWLARQGVHAVLRLRDAEVVGSRGGLWGVADRARSAAIASLAPAGDGAARQVAVGLAFGGSGALDAAAVQAFRTSGLAHLLAVSGGNIALLVALVVLLAWLLGGTRRQGVVLAMLAVALYVAVVGPSPSVVRAGCAGIAGCIAWLTGRPRAAWRALGLALGVLLAWNPHAILDVGLQLSFAAVAAILLVVPRVQRWAAGTSVPEPIAIAAAVTSAATLATAPIAWWHFGRATVVAALPANLLAAPAVPLSVWLGLATALLAPIAPAASAGLAWCAQWPAAWILQCAWLGAALAAATPGWLLPLLASAAAALLALGRRC